MRAALQPGGRFAGIRAVRLMLGRNLYRQARYEEGAEILESELRGSFDPNDPAIPWFYYFAGRCRELMGDRTTADRLYRTAEAAKTGGNIAKLAEDRRKNPDPENERRLRRARGLTRQRGRALDAAREWEGILADVAAGTMTVTIRSASGPHFAWRRPNATARPRARIGRWPIPPCVTGPTSAPSAANGDRAGPIARSRCSIPWPRAPSAAIRGGRACSGRH
jgi:hypothetical protein